MNGASSGTVGVEQPEHFEWMIKENFVQFFNHFVKHVKCTIENKSSDQQPTISKDGNNFNSELGQSNDMGTENLFLIATDIEIMSLHP